ncbi:YitT family protein [Paenibacillus nasutitermitis]|uniref:Membrane protein n=1 Tax=Paenibacillus nasutitermitis TaxID=1652958 RepID=A0A916YZI7_9BACL|nr:YitT family protein [Paenibacillus nasutitermitis]GGD69025.1 membrane protein [Paenibacillus nasutitermitis]
MYNRLFAQLKTWPPIMLGTAIYAFGLHYFILPNELMEGGVTGIAILLHYAFNWPLSLSTLLLNIPLFAVGWRYLGRSQLVYSLLGTLSLSLFLALIEKMIAIGWIVPFQTSNDYILAALYAGVTLGLGLGLVFRFGATTGGADIIARIASKQKGWSMGQIILFLDAVIIGSSLLYIPKEKVLYTLVAVFIASKVIDFIQEGAYAAKSFAIFTEDGEQLAKLITQEMDRGVTLFPAKGAFSGREKQVVYCVIARHEIRRLKTIIHRLDPLAFIVVTDVHDVLGEGFKQD